MFIVDDPKADSLPLPDTYGVDDIRLIIQDKRLNDDGSLDLSERIISPTGRLGDTILVNGTWVLQHEDRGMMVQFVVVERGQAGQTRVGDFAN
jgi:FtsP/CotA-like multicopper oxidase with cupredoxin domain